MVNPRHKIPLPGPEWDFWMETFTLNHFSKFFFLKKLKKSEKKSISTVKTQGF